MSVARIYIMNAAKGRGDELESQLRQLTEIFSKVQGCLSVELFRLLGDRNSFVFLHRWNSVDDHQKGLATLDMQKLMTMMSALAQIPQGQYIDPVLSFANLGAAT